MSEAGAREPERRDVAIYFTLTDSRPFTRIAHLRQTALPYLTRRLKCLLLVKECVVIPIVHVKNSEILQDLLRSHLVDLDPDSFAIAIRQSAGSVREYIEQDADSGHGSVDEYGPLQFLDRSQVPLVSFDPLTLSQKVKAIIADDVEAGQGPISKRFGDEATTVRDAVLSTDDMYLPHFSAKLEHKLEANLHAWIKAYYRLLAYTAAATEFGSECLVPEHNYFLVDAAPYRLDEYEVFTRILWQAYQIVTERQIPTDILDCLSFRDVRELRQRLRAGDFFRTYLELQEQVAPPAERSWEGIKLTVQEVIELDDQLRRTFVTAMQQQLGSFRSTRTRTRRREAVALVAKGLGGLVPGLGHVLSAAQITRGIASYVSGGDPRRRQDESVSSMQTWGVGRKIETGITLLQQMVARYVDRRLLID